VTVDRNKRLSSLLGARLWRLGCVLGVLCVLGGSHWCSRASADETASLPSASPERSALGDTAYPVCRASLRLRAVLYDAKSSDRSFASFGVGSEQPPRVLRRGARIAGHEITSIEQGAVVLLTQTQRCRLRLRGAGVERELRTIPVAVVRRELRARKNAAVAMEERALPAERALARIGGTEAHMTTASVTRTQRSL